MKRTNELGNCLVHIHDNIISEFLTTIEKQIV
jgi:hypothetical protein